MLRLNTTLCTESVKIGDNHMFNTEGVKTCDAEH